MIDVYLLLGSNENERLESLQKAKKLIESRCGKMIKQSQIYETEAWGVKEQHSFLNQAIAIETSLEPLELLQTLKQIEKETGRVETIKWGPRVIDIDILFYGNRVVETKELKIPHPYLHQRKFTLAPLNEIAAEFVHPLFNKSVNELFQECGDASSVNTLNSQFSNLNPKS